MNQQELQHLLSPIELGEIHLRNRVVMAPMTRSRVERDDCPGQLHLEYYRQRAGAGLIISEGVHPSMDGKGYCRTPGIYNDDQQAAWQTITDAVHAEGGSIVCQLMHCGRVGHPLNKDPQARFLAPSAVACKDKIFTEQGMLPMPEPEAMTSAEITATIADYVSAAQRAIAAGFDGVEIHCTSGYLPAQFLSTGTNQRDDQYGGSLENRLRFVLDVVDAVCAAVGSARVGLRACPGNPFNDLQDDNPVETFTALFTALNSRNLAYLHVIRMAATGIDNIALAKQCFHGPLIVNDSYSAAEANETIGSATADAVSFGRAFIANPDLVARFASGASLNRLDASTLYTPGSAGFIDYPALV